MNTIPQRTAHSPRPKPGPTVGIGHVNVDQVAVVPVWERDQKAVASHYFEQVGGPVPVALAAMARLGVGVPPVFLGVVGDDGDGARVREWLGEAGVDASSVQVSGGFGGTCKSMVVVDARDGARSLVNVGGDLASLVLDGDVMRLLKRASLLHIDGRDHPVCFAAAEVVRAVGGVVSLDLGTARAGTPTLLPLCDIVIASRKGGAGAFPAFAGSPEEQVRAFLDAGAAIAGVTLGAEGCVVGERLVDGTVGVERLAAYPVPDAADTNGAGDCFHGAFLWALLNGYRVEDAGHFAQAAVAVRIRRFGNRDGLPDRAAVEREAFQAPGYGSR
jgi:sugar/nucleoside kinase (ribokinase family)